MMRDEILKAIARSIEHIIHDYNNKLTPLEGNVSLIKSKTDNPSILEDIKDIEDIIDSMKGYRNQLRVFYSHKPQKSEFERFDLSSIVFKCSQKYISDLNISIDKKDVFFIEANKTEIEFLVDELMKNTLTHCGKNTNVNISLFVKEGYGVMIYEDKGKGVVDTLKIFIPFYTTNPSTKGLGLSYVWGITKRYGIDMDVESKVDMYMKFIFKFPSVSIKPL